MNYTYNITFVSLVPLEERLMSYLGKELLPAVCSQNIECHKIRKVIEVAGEEVGPDHGLSLAISFDFPDKDSAREWYENKFQPATQSLHELFGEEVVYFPTLLQNVEP